MTPQRLQDRRFIEKKSMKAFARFLYISSLTAYFVGHGITMAEEESSDRPAAGTMSVTVVSASATFPAGTSNRNDSRTETFTSMTGDPLGPFSGQSVMFHGTATGMSQVYLYRIDFDQEVTLDSIIVEGAAWIGDSPADVPSTIRLLDANSAEIANTIVDVPLAERNDFKSVEFDLTGITGTTFFLEEVNDICCWRYRSKIEINAVASTPDDMRGLIPILNLLLLGDDSEQASKNAN